MEWPSPQTPMRCEHTQSSSPKPSVSPLSLAAGRGLRMSLCLPWAPNVLWVPLGHGGIPWRAGWKQQSCLEPLPDIQSLCRCEAASLEPSHTCHTCGHSSGGSAPLGTLEGHPHPPRHPHHPPNEYNDDDDGATKLSWSHPSP